MEFLEVPLFDDDLFKLMVRFTINAFFLVLLIVLAYHPNQQKKNYVFSYLMMNVMVFFICFTLKKLDLGLGMALGLFAIFAIIRFRTGAIKIKDMTYLFIVIGIAVINSLSNKKTSYSELLFVNSAILGTTMLLERYYLRSGESSQTLVYDNMELLKPENRDQLLIDLKKLTGLEVTRVEVGKVDVKNNSGTITMFYDNSE